MGIIFKIVFFPFYVLKLLIILLATIAITIGGVFAILFGAEQETFSELIDSLWREGIKYKGFDMANNPESPLSVVFKVFLIVLGCCVAVGFWFLVLS